MSRNATPMLTFASGEQLFQMSGCSTVLMRLKNQSGLTESWLLFCDPTKYCTTEKFDPRVDLETQVECNFFSEEPNSIERVDIVIRSRRHAIQKPGMKPAFCILALCPGPLALPFAE